MKIATWNVNSVRMRIERVQEFLAQRRPDVLCLQELKCTNDDFPSALFESLGYSSAVNGEKTYNGVAILSNHKIQNVNIGLDDDEFDIQARAISAAIEGVRVFSIYVPNGGDLESDKYQFKLRWLNALRKLLDRNYSPKQPLVVCGDTNVIINDSDADDIAPWKLTGLGCDEVREKLAKVLCWGLEDLFHAKHPGGGIFSWWDYRQLAFPKNKGLRLDQIFATKPLAEKCVSCEVDREFRKGAKPSDHAPVMADFSI